MHIIFFLFSVLSQSLHDLKSESSKKVSTKLSIFFIAQPKRHNLLQNLTSLQITTINSVDFGATKCYKKDENIKKLLARNKREKL